MSHEVKSGKLDKCRANILLYIFDILHYIFYLLILYINILPCNYILKMSNYSIFQNENTRKFIVLITQ